MCGRERLLFSIAQIPETGGKTAGMAVIIAWEMQRMTSCLRRYFLVCTAVFRMRKTGIGQLKAKVIAVNHTGDVI